MNRFSARKMPISEIENGEQLENVIATRLGAAGRVRVLGTVMKKFLSPKYGFFVLDDTTGTMRVKAFQDDLKEVESVAEGSLVDVIGRVREYNGERYINFEAVSLVTDPNMISLRLLEIASEARKLASVKPYFGTPEALDAARRAGIAMEAVEGVLRQKGNDDEKKRVMELISASDEGYGASYQKLLATSGLSEGALETAINALLSDGVCYEPKPGFIKKL